MLKILGLISLLTLSLFQLACVAAGDEKNEINTEPGASDLILCEEPRPQVCTREYNPVCAKLRDGSTKTGATGCTACSDPDIVGYKMGAC